MKLYATVTSERATKGQGGNEHVTIELTAGNAKEPVWMGSITMREIAPDTFQVFYTAPRTGKGDKSGILYQANLTGSVFSTKGKRQKGECMEGGNHFTTREGDEEICRKCLQTI